MARENILVIFSSPNSFNKGSVCAIKWLLMIILIAFFCNMCRWWLFFNPIRSGLFQTVNDPGGGALKAPPPTISKIIVLIFTISYMCILPGVFGMIQLEFFKNSRFWPFYSDFKIKSSENSCKNNIFVISFKIDFKYTKRRGILMRI